MNRILTITTAVIAAAAALGATSQTTRVPPLLPHRPVSFADSYRLLERRNIFDSSRNGDTEDRRPIVYTPPAVNTFTLTGLEHEDGAYSAFIENSLTNLTTEYKVGDTVSNGKITAVGMDYLDLNTNGRTIRVYLGQTLAGTSPTSATTNPSSTQPASPEDSMIERLRQRRLNELKQ